MMLLATFRERSKLWITTIIFLSGCATVRDSVTGKEIAESEETKAPAIESPISQIPTPLPAVPTQSIDQLSAEKHFSLAQAYAADGKTDQAVEEYRLAATYDSTSPLVWTRLAAELLKQGSISNALEASNRALSLDPKYVDAHMLAGSIYAASKDNARSIQAFETVLNINPDQEEAAIFKCQLLIESEKFPEAVATAEKFLARNSASPLTWYYLGRARHRNSEFEAAALAYRNAIEQRPTFAQAGLALGLMYEEIGNDPKALEAYKDSFDRTQDPIAGSRASTILLKSERYQEAAPILEAIKRIDPDDLNSQIKLGLVQMEMKHWEGAITTFHQVIKKQPDSDRVHFYLGNIYEETKQIDLAVKSFLAVIPSSRLYSDAVLHAAFLLRQNGKPKEALALLSDGIHKSKFTAGFYVLKANILEEKKDLKTSIAVLENGSQALPQDERILYYLGSLYDRAGRVSDGMKQMETILAVNPDNADALNYVGYTLTTQGTRLDEAEGYLRKAISLRPNDGYIRDSLGWHFFVTGKVELAVLELEKAAALLPDEPAISDHLGDVYMKLNMPHKAHTFYENAIRFSTDETTKEKISKKLVSLESQLGNNKEIRKPASHESPEQSTVVKNTDSQEK